APLVNRRRQAEKIRQRSGFLVAMKASDDIIENAGSADEPDILECPRHAGAREHRRTSLSDILIAQQYPSVRYFEKAGAQVDDRGLACAVRANETGDAA